MIGLSGSQFFERMSACANGDSSSANGTGALYVQGCITDDPNSVGVEVGTMAGVYFLQRLSCYIVPLVMMIAKAAEIEIVIDTKMRELDSRSAASVTSEQAQSHVAGSMKSFQERQDAWKHRAGAVL